MSNQPRKYTVRIDVPPTALQWSFDGSLTVILNRDNLSDIFNKVQEINNSFSDAPSSCEGEERQLSVSTNSASDQDQKINTWTNTVLDQQPKMNTSINTVFDRESKLNTLTNTVTNRGPKLNYSINIASDTEPKLQTYAPKTHSRRQDTHLSQSCAYENYLSYNCVEQTQMQNAATNTTVNTESDREPDFNYSTNIVRDAPATPKKSLRRRDSRLNQNYNLPYDYVQQPNIQDPIPNTLTNTVSDREPDLKYSINAACGAIPKVPAAPKKKLRRRESRLHQNFNFPYDYAQRPNIQDPLVNTSSNIVGQARKLNTSINTISDEEPKLNTSNSVFNGEPELYYSANIMYETEPTTQATPKKTSHSRDSRLNQNYTLENYNLPYDSNQQPHIQNPVSNTSTNVVSDREPDLHYSTNAECGTIPKVPTSPQKTSRHRESRLNQNYALENYNLPYDYNQRLNIQDPIPNTLTNTVSDREPDLNYSTNAECGAVPKVPAVPQKTSRHRDSRLNQNYALENYNLPYDYNQRLNIQDPIANTSTKVPYDRELKINTSISNISDYSTNIVSDAESRLQVAPKEMLLRQATGFNQTYAYQNYNLPSDCVQQPRIQDPIANTSTNVVSDRDSKLYTSNNTVFDGESKLSYSTTIVCDTEPKIQTAPIQTLHRRDCRLNQNYALENYSLPCNYNQQPYIQYSVTNTSANIVSDQERKLNYSTNTVFDQQPKLNTANTISDRGPKLNYSTNIVSNTNPKFQTFVAKKASRRREFGINENLAFENYNHSRKFVQQSNKPPVVVDKQKFSSLVVKSDSSSLVRRIIKAFEMHQNSTKPSVDQKGKTQPVAADGTQNASSQELEFTLLVNNGAEVSFISSPKQVRESTPSHEKTADDDWVSPNLSPIRDGW